jgi:hypothetical protein
MGAIPLEDEGLYDCPDCGECECTGVIPLEGEWLYDAFLALENTDSRRCLAWLSDDEDKIAQAFVKPPTDATPLADLSENAQKRVAIFMANIGRNLSYLQQLAEEQGCVED